MAIRRSARLRARRRRESAADLTSGWPAHRYAVLLGTPFSLAHRATDLPCAIARASWVFFSWRSSLVMACGDNEASGRDQAIEVRPLQLDQKYKPDFICFEKIIVEIKAVKELTAEHRAQVFNYLHATGYKLGLLVNFGYYPKVESERIVL